MEETKYTLTISLENEQGSVCMKYGDVSREELLRNEKTAAALRIHDLSFPKDAPEEGAKP